MIEKKETQLNTNEWPKARYIYGKSAIRLENFATKYPTLYHGTDKVGAQKILQTGTVGHMQLSFTPDYSVAKGYADEKDGTVISIKTKDIDPSWLEETFKEREYYNRNSANNTFVIQVGRPRLGQEPMVINIEIVQDKGTLD